MIVLYLVLGLILGFLIKFEIDNRARQKRLKQKQKYIEEAVQPYEETLTIVKELNESLLTMQKQNQIKVYQERRKYS